MSSTKLDRLFLKTLQEAIKSKDASGNIDLRFQNQIGFELSYFLTEILEKDWETVIKKKWIDCVEWKSLYSIDPGQIEGAGQLWWGFRDDVSNEFPEDFYCKIQLKSVGKKKVFSYLFEFQIDKTKFELRDQ